MRDIMNQQVQQISNDLCIANPNGHTRYINLPPKRLHSPIITSLHIGFKKRAKYTSEEGWD